MFTPSNATRAEESKADAEAYQKLRNRQTALEHTVDLAKTSAAKWGSKGYTAEELLAYAGALANFLNDGTIPEALVESTNNRYADKDVL